MDIAFVVDGEPFNGGSVEERALGGTESAVTYMGRELVKLGHQVSVYTNCDRPGLYQGVMYGGFGDFKDPKDVLVSVRDFESLKASNAGLKVYWVHDAYNQPVVQRRIHDWPAADRIFTISAWQTETFREVYQIPQEMFFVTRNGIDRSFFTEPGKRDTRRALYMSAPYRGLGTLLDLFPELRDREGLRLTVFGAAGTEDPVYKRARETPGVELMLGAKKEALIEHLSSSYLMLYPNIFPETSCIAALQAQAAGVPLVTSRLGALPETVKGGILIPGDARSEEYQKRFVKETLALLKDRKKWEALSEAGRSHVLANHTWDRIAREWEQEFRLAKGD